MKLLNYNHIKLGKFNHFFGDPKKQSDACESESLKFGYRICKLSMNFRMQQHL